VGTPFVPTREAGPRGHKRRAHPTQALDCIERGLTVTEQSRLFRTTQCTLLLGGRPNSRVQLGDPGIAELYSALWVLLILLRSISLYSVSPCLRVR